MKRTIWQYFVELNASTGAEGDVAIALDTMGVYKYVSGKWTYISDYIP